MADVHTGSRAVALKKIVRDAGGLYTIGAQPDAGFSAPIRARQEGHSLWLEIETPPRTKKNGRAGAFFGAGGGTAYKKYRSEIAGAIAALKGALELPLPSPMPRDRSIGYNIAIRYYVDGYGRNADRPGLDQALFDALVYAGVVNDDWYLRSTEGTPPPIGGDDRPRVELVITPLPGAASTP